MKADPNGNRQLDLVLGIMEQNVPTARIAAATLAAGLSPVDALLLVNAAPSRAAARRVIQQGGFTVNNVPWSDVGRLLTLVDAPYERYVVLGSGKRHRYVLIIAIET